VEMRAGETAFFLMDVQWNSTYPDPSYPDRQLSGSARPSGLNLSRIMQK